MNKQLGQISISVLASIIGPFLLAAIGFGWNAMSKSDKAIEKASQVELRAAAIEGDVKEIRADVRWIRETISNQRLSGFASSSFDGHK